MAILISPLAAAALGAAGMYFFDPDTGRRRRALVRDKAVHFTTKAQDMLCAGAVDLQQRTRGTFRALAAQVDREPPSDRVLAERVRAKLGRYVSHPRAIEVSANSGEVVLSGSILRDEHAHLLAAVRAVRGVQSVIDQLVVHDTADGVSELQGGSVRQGERLDIFQENWSPGTRLAGTAAAGSLGLIALRTGGILGLLLGTASALFMSRCVSRGPVTHR